MGNNGESGWDNVEDIEEENKNISMDLKESANPTDVDFIGIPKSQNYFSLYCKSYIAKHKGLENSFKGSQ
ncbi:13230_t:CDS:2 [Entrophospora sp. SA101]|nr:13230_t:CDS:2 [Entrophospora sp. SA101]